MGRALPKPSAAYRFFVATVIVPVFIASLIEECRGNGAAYAELSTFFGATSVAPFQFSCPINVQVSSMNETPTRRAPIEGTNVMYAGQHHLNHTSISSPEIAWNRVLNAAESLLSIWLNPSCNPHCFINGSFWTDANALEALLNLKAEADIHLGGNSSWAQLVQKITIDIYLTQDTTPLLVAPPFFDDALWWGLAWLRAYEEYGNSAYLDRSKGILETVYSLAWDNSSCGGGVWWSAAKAYKNAITVELFTALSSKLTLVTGNDTIQGWAIQAFGWFNQSGMINSSNLINDGLNGTCQNNNGTTWTYNQGVILSASTNLYQITNDSYYLNYADTIACAALTRLAFPNDGVLMDVCDLWQGGCFGDGQQFKGVFVRHLLYATRVLETVTLRPAPWRHDIGNMADILWANARKQNNTVNELGGNWNGPFDGATPIKQAAALDLLIFAATEFNVS